MTLSLSISMYFRPWNRPSRTISRRSSAFAQETLSLHQNHLKINLDKCVFGNKEVSYLGFTLTPEGIKPGRNKLQAIKDAKPPTTIKMVRSFVGLCNFFRTHIKDFAIIAAPLFQVTRKDSGYKSGPLPPAALQSFKILQQQLTSDPVMAFPRMDRQYARLQSSSIYLKYTCLLNLLVYFDVT